MPVDLHKWLRDRKLTQAGLAAALNVSRRTINSWANGVSVPDDLAERLAALVVPAVAQNAPQATPALPVPKWVSVKTAPDLYRRMGTAIVRLDHHPLELLGEHIRDEHGRCPWTILDSPEYQQALAAHRAKDRKPLAAGKYGLPDADYFEDE